MPLKPHHLPCYQHCQSQKKPLNSHLQALSDDADDDKIPTTSSAPADPSRLWMTEYNDYLNTHEFVLGEMGTVQWWGVHSILKLFHTVHLCDAYQLDQCAMLSNLVLPCCWQSCNNVIICVKWAGVFSRGYHNHQVSKLFKGGHCESVVLQCLKCLLRRDLIFCTPVEDDLDNEDSDDAGESWKCFVENDSDNDGFDTDDESL